MKALVTGIGGFAGSHLAEYLLAQGLEVCGILLPGEATTNLDAVKHCLTLHEADLTDAGGVCQVVEEERPDLVYHLAAQAAVSKSWEDPASTLIINIMSQLNLLQAVLAANIRPRILIVGSYEEYGSLRPEELPAKETSPLHPTNPYGVSKIAQDMMGYQYFSSHGLCCVRVRPFNHLGPRQSETFVAPSFAKQVAEAEAGLREPVVRVGNLEAERDFTDVRDIVRGYYLALLHGEAGDVYNLGSGRATSVQCILDFFLAHAKIGLSVEQDPSLIRPLDVPMSVCDFSKLKDRTGWEPEIPLERTLSDVLEYWRNKVAPIASGLKPRYI